MGSAWQAFSNLANNVDSFLSTSETAVHRLQCSYKDVYERMKSLERQVAKAEHPMVPSVLLVNDFSDEQVWQQLELHNNFSLPRRRNDVKRVNQICMKPSISEESTEKDVEYDDITNDDDDDDLQMSKDDLFDDHDGEVELLQSDDEGGGTVQSVQNAPRSAVDDEFFSLHEMERFVESDERLDASGIGALLSENLFDQDNEVDDERNLNLYYNDFFNPPNNGPGKSDRKVTFASNTNFKDGHTENMDEEEEEEEEEVVEEDVDNEGEEEIEEPKSSFERRQQRMNALMSEIEEENVGDKPWQLSGETSTGLRPENSLLEEQLLFDRASRLPPVVTPETTENLEAMIKRRIRDKAWDDVERKVKPTVDLNVYKNELLLDQQKSKLSLSEIYEQEYLKKTQQLEEKTDNPAHKEIRKRLEELFFKLDALSNFQYTPRPPVPEMAVVKNLPSIVMEEVAPVTTSDATLLAPEEVKRKRRHQLTAPEESSTTEKKRRLKRKKKFAGLRAGRAEAVATKKGRLVPKDKMQLLSKIGTVKKTAVFDDRKRSLSSVTLIDKLQAEVQRTKDDVLKKMQIDGANNRRRPANSSAAVKL